MTDDDGFVVTDRPGQIDRDAVWEFLSEQVPWGRWRTREVLESQVDGAWRVVGVVERASGRLVGFARAVSDGVSLAYLADVFVSPEHRGHGLAARMLRLMIDDGPGAHFRWMLHTDEAHGLYAKFGFAAPTGTYMERPGRAPAAAGAAGATGATIGAHAGAGARAGSASGE